LSFGVDGRVQFIALFYLSGVSGPNLPTLLGEVGILFVEPFKLLYTVW